MGGWLLDQQGSAIAYWADELTTQDFVRFSAVRGDPAWQAEWELLAILVSLHAFEKEVSAARFLVKVQSDSMAALGVALKLASPRHLMNALAAELALKLEDVGAEFILTEHIPGVHNVEADALSRL